MNRRELNVLQMILVEEEFQKDTKSESKFPKVIIDDEYYRIKNIDELKQILEEKTLSNALVNMEEVNKRIRSIFKKRSMTFYSNNRETQSNNEYECITIFEQQLNEVVEALEVVLSNDANIQSKRCTTKCWTMCHDDKCVKCQSWKTKHCEKITKEQ